METDSQPAEISKPKNSLRYWLIGAATFLVALLAWNATVFVPVSQALADEDGGTTIAYRRWLIPSWLCIFELDITWPIVGMSVPIYRRRAI